MIKFKKITIHNYKSIEKAELLYTKGVWVVKGNNNDAVFKSNGAGKSTVLEAIQQGLYNKNTKGITIEDTYNRNTNKGYRIIIEFSVDSDNYLIDNDRELSTIKIFKNSTDISKKGIAENLKEIQNIIGFDFTTFSALTYVSHQTVTQLLDTFTSSSLMKILLDFDSITEFESKVKDSLNKSKSSMQYLIQENTQMESTAQLMSEFIYTDLTNLYKRKQDLNDKLLAGTLSIGLDTLTSKMNAYSNKLIEVDKEIEMLKAKAYDLVCPTCGSSTNHGGTVTRAIAKADLEEKYKEQKELQLNILRLTLDIDEASDNLTKVRAEYSQNLSMVDTQINIGEYKNKLYQDNKEIISNTQAKLAYNKQKLSEEYFNQDLFDVLLKTIKSGKLHKELLENFTKILNLYIDDYMKYMSISYLNVKTKALKASIEFIVYDSRSNSFVGLNTLSGGELTRVRVVVLMSMLKAISTITNMSTNILVLDEALDTLDKSAATDLGSLFQYLIDTEDKFIALVSHGEQLSEIDFTGTIRAIKSDKNTTIQQG